jgi:hypothetical protein
LRPHKLPAKDCNEYGGQNRRPASGFYQDILLRIYAGHSRVLNFNDAQQNVAFCEVSCNARLACTDLESLVGVVLHAFDLPCKCGSRPIAVNVIPVLLCPNQPGSATRTMRCYHAAAYGCFVLVSILPTQHLNNRSTQISQLIDKPQLRLRRFTRARNLRRQICWFERTYPTTFREALVLYRKPPARWTRERRPEAGL